MSLSQCGVRAGVNCVDHFVGVLMTRSIESLSSECGTRASSAHASQGVYAQVCQYPASSTKQSVPRELFVLFFPQQ